MVMPQEADGRQRICCWRIETVARFFRQRRAAAGWRQSAAENASEGKHAVAINHFDGFGVCARLSQNARVGLGLPASWQTRSANTERGLCPTDLPGDKPHPQYPDV